MQSDDFFSITGAQLRAARALLRWSAEDLATNARVGIATVRRSEAPDGIPTTTVANIQAMKAALGAAGVLFIAENGEGPGVRLTKARAKITTTM